MLRNRDNGGLCPFIWQELRVFIREHMAGSCHIFKCFVFFSLREYSRRGGEGFCLFYLGIFASPWRKA